MKLYEEHLEHILSEFDFEKVHVAMYFMNWGWVDGDTSTITVPNVTRIKHTALRLLEQAWTFGHLAQGDYSVATGGFKAKFFWYDGNPLLELDFILESKVSEYV
jgi:hypothetical protein